LSLIGSHGPFVIGGHFMSAHNGQGRGLSVLVLDDHLDVADSLALFFRCYGHRAAVEVCGTKALAAVQRDRPDVVVMELRLAGTNGWDLARRIKAVGDGVRLIAVTTCTEPEDRERSRAAGFELHLTKPVDPDVLLSALG
jgi:CheY-like chemotaxis protein